MIGNDGERFCVGANLFMVAMAVQSGQLDELEAMHKQLAGHDAGDPLRAQAGRDRARTTWRSAAARRSIMAGARVVAHAELYAGLVEVGVGLIPGVGRL